MGLGVVMMAGFLGGRAVNASWGSRRGVRVGTGGKVWMWVHALLLTRMYSMNEHLRAHDRSIQEYAELMAEVR